MPAFVVLPWVTSSHACGLVGNSLSSVLSRQIGTSAFFILLLHELPGVVWLDTSHGVLKMEWGPISDTIPYILMFKQRLKFDCLVEESLQDVLLQHVLKNMSDIWRAQGP